MKLSAAAAAFSSNVVKPKRRKHNHKEQVMKVFHKKNTEVYAIVLMSPHDLIRYYYRHLHALIYY